MGHHSIDAYFIDNTSDNDNIDDQEPKVPNTFGLNFSLNLEDDNRKDNVSLNEEFGYGDVNA